MRSVPSLAGTFASLLIACALTACSDEEAGEADPVLTGAGAGLAASADPPSVVVTTNVLGDIVATVLGDQIEIEVIMPLGADPHDFAASAQQAEAMEQADLLVINGAGFEEGLLGIIESAEQADTPVFAFSEHIDLLALAGEHQQHDEGEEHEEEEEQATYDTAHTDEEHRESEGSEHAEGEEHDDAEGPDDPHIWTDPSRMATAVAAFADRASQIEGIDAAAIEAQASHYVEKLKALDAEIDRVLGKVPPEQRVLVTNHEVFGYFADRYDFEVIGTVIPSVTTNAGASAAAVESLAEVIREREVPAIFGETTQPTALAEAIADEVGGSVEVVELYTESLGEDGSGAETYVGMMQRNAELIAGALA